MVNQQNSESFFCIANWKMNGDLNMCKNLTLEIDKAAKFSGNTVIIAPSFPFLTTVKGNSSNIKLAAQDCYEQHSGAFTGEVSPTMLKGLGCEYVILGHSERREILGEDNQIVSRKAYRAIENGLITIICIGETQKQRQDGQTFDVLSAQLAGSLPENANNKNCIVAYEPVWAIGSGSIPSAKEINDIHEHIYTQCGFNVVYGGSVKASNIKEIKDIPKVSGVLVGGASLKAEEFNKIINVE